MVLTKALLRRGCAPKAAAVVPATGLLDPAHAAYHAAAMEAAKVAGVTPDFSSAAEGVAA